MKTRIFKFQYQVIGVQEGGEEFITKLKKLLKLRYQNDIELHLKDVEKRGDRIEIQNSDYNLAGFDLFKSENSPD